jgi:5-methylcytosine-specific restriction endonuclease McrA
MPISEEAKQFVRKRANYLCEYCHSSERVSPSRFTMEHIIPQSLGGPDHTANLALACRRCNERQYNFVEALDPQTQQIVPLFNPREQVWREHFVWLNDYTVLEGLTAIGRATFQCLDLNDERYLEEDSIRATRRLWVQAGLHPPKEDL